MVAFNWITYHNFTGLDISINMGVYSNSFIVDNYLSKYVDVSTSNPYLLKFTGDPNRGLKIKLNGGKGGTYPDKVDFIKATVYSAQTPTGYPPIYTMLPVNYGYDQDFKAMNIKPDIIPKSYIENNENIHVIYGITDPETNGIGSTFWTSYPYHTEIKYVGTRGEMMTFEDIGRLYNFPAFASPCSAIVLSYGLAIKSVSEYANREIMAGLSPICSFEVRTDAPLM